MPGRPHSRIRRAARLVLLSLLLAAPSLALAQGQAGSGAAGQAAQAPAAPADGGAGTAIPAAELESLLATLQDPAARERLIGDLRALIEVQQRGGAGAGTAAAPVPPGENGSRLLRRLSASIDALSQNLVQAMRAIAELPQSLLETVTALRERDVRDRLLEILGKLAIVLGAAFAAEFVVKRLLARPRRRLEERAGASLVTRAAFLLLRTLLDVLPLAAFAGIAYGVLPMTEPRPVTSLVALVLINANVIARVVSVVGRAVFVPQAGGLRLVPLGDESAHYGYIWVRRFTVVGIYGYFLLEAARLLGLDRSAHALLLNLLGLLIAGMLVVLVLQLRQPVAESLRGDGESRLAGLRARLAEMWHIVAVVYILATYVVWVLDLPGGFNFLARATLLSLLVIAGAKVASVLAGRAIDRGFRLNRDLSRRYPLLERRLNRYLPVLRRILNVAIVVVSVLLFFEVWGATPFAWLASEAGRGFVSSLFSILLILGGALLVLEVFGAVVENYLNRREQDPAAGSARVATLLPLAQNALRVLLTVMVALIVLSELGIDIAPLLAGAGVVGLAIGFGAQTLVKDVITGVFILLENTVSTGDVAEVGGRAGVVEGMTIRTIRLRDLEGNLHIMPFSEVTTVKNFGMEFAYALIDMGVAYREDVDEVIAVMRAVAQELREESDVKDHILADLEVLGLDRFDDSAVIIRVRFKTKPFTQWSVRREYNRRLKRAFDERGIEIPFPHTTVYFGEDKTGEAPPLRLARTAGRPAGGTAAPAARGEDWAEAKPRGRELPDPEEASDAPSGEPSRG